MNAHAKRWLTALSVGPLVAALIIFGSNVLFAFFVALLIVLAVLEYSRMCFGVHARSEAVEGIVLGLAIAAAAYSEPGMLLVGTLTAACIASIVFFLFRNRHGDIDLAPLGKSLLGFVAIPLLISHIMMIRNLDDGIAWIFLIFFVAVAGDVAAFYIGRTFGKRKLMPTVSPGKTKEGAAASVVGSVAVACIYGHFFLPSVAIGHIILMSAPANVLGQLGDLSESLIKRSAGAKDSGRLFPGHGGVLDRLDAFLFSAPFVYYYKVFIIG